MTDTSASPSTTARTLPPIALVLLAAAGTFAVTMGARQSMGLFLGNLNTHTGLGIASISLAFAFGQLWWGLTQPFAGIVADRIGAGRVLLAGVLLVAMGLARLGKMVRFMPYPVTTGFTSGIAAVIATLQVKDLLGLEATKLPDHFIDRLGALWQARYTARLIR